MASLRHRIEAVQQRVAGRSQPRVLALEWLDPPFVPGHWVPEMVELAGGKGLFGNPAQRSYEVSWSDLAGSEPDILIVMPCGFGLKASRADAFRHAERLYAVAPKAIESNRAYVVDASSYFNRSGPRVVDGVEILAGLLHNEAFAYLPLTARAARWP